METLNKAFPWIKKGTALCGSFFNGYFSMDQTLSTRLERKQEVHTYTLLTPPLSVLTRTDFTLDFHILLVLLCEWLT